MKILLVKPYNASDHIQPSLGLGYLASALRGDDDVEILDCIKENVRPADFKKELDRSRPDAVGIQCYTYDLANVKEMLAACKERGAVTIVGGPHPSAAPAETMAFLGKDLDYAFSGEAEVGLKALIDKLCGRSEARYETIPGLAWRDGKEIALNERYFAEDIDAFGLPAWDLIKPQTYPEAQHGAFFKNFPIAPIMTTRGCPFSCTFCAGNLISGKRLRKRGVRSIIDEMKTLYYDYGIREFHIIDDNFTLDKDFAKRLITRLKEARLDISWSVPNGVRVDSLDDELLSLMRETGLYLISLGIESGSDRVLELMRKGQTTGKIRDGVNMIRRHGIDIAGFFILGFPGETIEDIEKTIDLSLQLDLVRANFFTYLPFPGTESYDTLKREGKLDSLDTDRFCFMNASFTPEGLSEKELRAFQRSAFMKFFLRPRILWYNLRRIKSFGHFKFLFRRFVHWILG